MIYDEESLLEDVKNLLDTKLTEQFVKINREKNAVSGNYLYLDPIPQDAIIFEILDKRVLNFAGYFIYYGLSPATIREESRAGFIEDWSIYINFAVFDSGELFRNNIFLKLIRYRRGLIQAILDDPGLFRSFAKPLIKNLRPDSFPYSKNRIIINLGIELSASIAI